MWGVWVPGRVGDESQPIGYPTLGGSLPSKDVGSFGPFFWVHFEDSRKVWGVFTKHQPRNSQPNARGFKKRTLLILVFFGSVGLGAWLPHLDSAMSHEPVLFGDAGGWWEAIVVSFNSDRF